MGIGPIAALILMAAASAPTDQPGADRFCSDLRRIVAAAHRSPPFASIPQIDARGARPYFGFAHDCGIVDDPRDHHLMFACSEQLPPEEVTVSDLATRTRRCLPGVVAIPYTPRNRIFEEYSASFRIDGIVITATEGGERTAGGRRAAFLISAPGPLAPGPVDRPPR
jgi:hypothetical protein